MYKIIDVTLAVSYFLAPREDRSEIENYHPIPEIAKKLRLISEFSADGEDVRPPKPLGNFATYLLYYDGGGDFEYLFGLNDSVEGDAQSAAGAPDAVEVLSREAAAKVLARHTSGGTEVPPTAESSAEKLVSKVLDSARSKG